VRVLFFGTPEVAVPFLELLAKSHDVAAVVSQPDKPAGRGLSLAPTPVKRKALELGLKVLQPEKPSQIAGELKALGAELSVVVAYGRILKPEVLSAARLGALNVHFSLLPKFRGAAPVQWSLVRGETRTGVTLFWLDEGMDTGPVFLMKETEVGPDEDAGELMGRLQALGLAALDEALAKLARGQIERMPQRGEPSPAPLIKREDALVSWARPAREIHNLVRGFRVWPRACLQVNGQRVLILKTRLEPEPAPRSGGGRPGAIMRIDRTGPVLVECADGSCLWLLVVQPEGKKPVNAAEFLNGLRLGAGDFLSA